MKTFKYPCLHISQRTDGAAPTFCVFAAKAREIMEWAVIERYTSESKKGPQRLAKTSKVRAVERFFEKDKRNTIPTSIIIGLTLEGDYLQKGDSPLTEELRYLIINFDETSEKRPGLIIDGQHRLLGMNKFSGDTLVNVVALLNPDEMEIAFQFLVINNKVAKVPADHMRALATNYKEDELQNRLTAVRLSLNPNLSYVEFADRNEASPFKGIIAWPDNPPERQIVAPAAMEASIPIIQETKLREFENVDTLLDFFFAIWTSIKDKWPDLWTKDSNLLKKVSIVCFTRHLTDMLVAQSDWTDFDLSVPDEVKDATNKLLAKAVAKEFWTALWTAKSLDTQAGRDLLMASLKQMARNLKDGEPWYTDITMVSLLNE